MDLSVKIENCPCSGKNMNLYIGPWILLVLHGSQGTHGYEIAKMVKGHLEEIGLSLNITGLYRQLKTLEQRGMLRSHWENPERGMARRKYVLTEEGEHCLWAWLNTLLTEFRLISRFFKELKVHFPSVEIPDMENPGGDGVVSSGTDSTEA